MQRHSVHPALATRASAPPDSLFTKGGWTFTVTHGPILASSKEDAFLTSLETLQQSHHHNDNRHASHTSHDPKHDQQAHVDEHDHEHMLTDLELDKDKDKDLDKGLETTEVVSSSSELSQSLHRKIPTMLFDMNSLTVQTSTSNGGHWALKFDALGALARVGKLDPKIRVNAASAWEKKEKRSNVQILHNVADWTFTTQYVGEITSSSDRSIITDPSHCINYEWLRRQDIPIQFYKEVLLFEDELDDNGIASYTVRIRVMDDFFFILARFFLRVDRVIVRSFDTRFYHEFGQNYVIEEICRKESAYSDVLKATEGDMSIVRQPDQVQAHLQTVSTESYEYSLG